MSKSASLPTFNIVSGDKGGVGKSMTALALIDYASTGGLDVVVIEADTSNPDVARMYENSLPTFYADLHNENGWMEVMDAVTQHPNATFVVSMPAGIGHSVNTHLPALQSFLSKRNVAIEPVLWWVMNPQHDSVNLLAEAMTTYGKHFSKVRVVCNTHFSDNKSDMFFLWQEAPLRSKLEKDGAVTIFLPGLNLRVVTKLFHPGKIIPFADAIDASLSEGLDLKESERFKLEHWRDLVATCFASAFVLPNQKAAPAAEVPKATAKA